jgi:hypothetical protein
LTADFTLLTHVLARFALHQDFDLVQFNSLLLFVEGQQFMDSQQPVDSHMNRYQTLCDFILEIATELIAPDLVHTRESGLERFSYPNQGAVGRYGYFFGSVIKASVWHDQSELFENLKAAATRFMEEISHVCRMRHEELAAKSRGNELLSFVWPGYDYTAAAMISCFHAF